MTAKTINVLVVEDDDDYALLLTQRLANHGVRSSFSLYGTTRLSTLDEAIRYVANHPVDVILLDLSLPGTTGLNTLERMQSAAPATAIIVLTATADKTLTAQALQLGAEDYLVKGQYSKELLLRSIGYALERKAGRNALLASERKWRSLIENASDVVIIVNSSLVLTYASPSLGTLLGYIPANAVGSYLLDFVHTYDAEQVKTTFAAARQTPGISIQAANIRIQHADGSWRIFSAIITNLLADQAVQGIVINARDVTEQQQVEEMMRKAQRLESVALLAGGIAHDFNNLLTNIIAQNALALAKLSTDSPARPHIGKANNAVSLAVSLTRQLLAYVGHEYIQVEAVNLNTLLQKNLTSLEASLGHSIKLTLDLADPLPTIDAGVGQIQQIILNLVINGAEAIYPNPGQITITTNVVELGAAEFSDYGDGENLRAGAYVMLEVNDDGRGMDRATQARIFEPFFSTKPHGYGLGLPATLDLLRAHRGALRVQSELGKGAQVRLLFPIGKLQSQHAPDDRELDRTTTTAVLLIDDEKLLLEALADLLGVAGLQTLTALHGKQGLELFKHYHHKIAVVVLDMKMPVMDGAETLRLLHEFDPDVDVIIVSAYGIPEKVQRLIDNRKITLITKPFDIDSLLSKIISTVVRHQQEQ